jgi:RNA polymerase sigma-70 factor (ECF subfamily)
LPEHNVAALSNDEDLALSRRAAAGDKAAFAMLVEKHERPLRSFLTHMAGAQFADDLAQDAFIKAWRSAGQYDGRARYSTWLTRIAWRCRIDQVRKERSVETVALWDVGTIGLQSDIRDIIARLSETERAALVLCEGHGWTHPEAAEMLEIPLGTLKTTVARAKAKCRALWEHDEHG